MKIEAARRCDRRGFYPGESVTGRTLEELQDRVATALLVATAHPSMEPYTHVVAFRGRETYLVKEEK